MNLLEAERLVKRITDLLQKPGPESSGLALAQEYVTACQAIIRRLEQCTALLSAGSEQQALQLADAAPPLLDMITRLAFQQAVEWRQYCKKNELPAVEPFDSKSIRLLSEAYGRGFSQDHPLYRDYRAAIMRQNDEQAVVVLRKIIRRSPGDANAIKEKDRLVRKVLNARLEKLRQTMAADQVVETIQQAQEIEALNYELSPSGAVWQQAQKFRCRDLLSQAQAVRETGNWQRTGELLGQLKSLQEECSVRLEPEASDAIADGEKWIAACELQDAEERKFERAIQKLQQQVEQCEQAQLAAPLPSSKELHDRLETLEHHWRELEQFHRPIATDLNARTQKARQYLQDQQAQEKRKRRNFILVGMVILTVLAIVVGLWIYQQHKVRDYDQELAALRTARQVVAAEKLLEQLRQQNAALTESSRLRTALEQTAVFLQQEYQRKTNCEAALAQLAKLVADGFTSLSPQQIQTNYDRARQTASAAAPDFKPQLASGLQTMEHHWTSWLEQQRQIRREALRKQISVAETMAAGLKYERTPAEVETTLTQLAPLLAEAQNLATAPIPALAPSAEATASLETLKNKAAIFSREVERWERILAVWRSPNTITNYLASLREYQKSAFAPPAGVSAAGQLASLNPSVQLLLGPLLLPGHSEAWNLFLNRPSNVHRPTELLPRERSLLVQLRDDENVNNTFAYEIVMRDGSDHWPVYSRAPLGTNRAGYKIGFVYNPKERADVLEFKQSVLSPINRSILELGRSRESTAFDQLAIFDGRRGTNCTDNFLGVLDGINRLQDQGVNALFQAYLALRLHQCLELRPIEWGVPWAPSLTADRKRLEEMGAKIIASGDWFVPNKVQMWTNLLHAHFAKARQLSYVNQGFCLRDLAKRTLDAGFAVAGYVDLNGQPIETSTTAASELWGWNRSQAPDLLYRRRAGKLEAVQPPMLFTPLLAFRGARADLLREVAAAQRVDLEALKLYLPPFYQLPPVGNP
ncbi:MAG: hypothetical protein WCO56_19840 [Verrucomicrobiota bacterium]